MILVGEEGYSVQFDPTLAILESSNDFEADVWSSFCIMAMFGLFQICAPFRHIPEAAI